MMRYNGSMRIMMEEDLNTRGRGLDYNYIGYQFWSAVFPTSICLQNSLVGRYFCIQNAQNFFEASLYMTRHCYIYFPAFKLQSLENPVHTTYNIIDRVPSYIGKFFYFMFFERIQCFSFFFISIIYYFSSNKIFLDSLNVLELAFIT